MDCNLPGSFVHGISQTSILEKVAISFSRAFSSLRDEIRVSSLQADSLALSHPGSSIVPLTGAFSQFTDYF